MQLLNTRSILLQIRAFNQWSQEDLARALGMKRNSIARWEQENTRPQLSFSQIKRFIPILEEAGFSLNDLPD
jgi:transcriptional regulator with XRE-family HTH domain